jgi:NAD(P)-dependent dehydrogenase (short-subunit alcohol dehydrogenase family)
MALQAILRASSEESMSQVAKRVVITGAAGALGAAVAHAFAAAGAELALIDHAADPKDLVKTLGPPHFFLGGIDLANPAQAQSAIDTAAARLGSIDVLVNVAGGFRWETVAEGKVETWDLLYAINLKTAVCACKSALPHLPAQQGRIINIGAGAASKAGMGMGAYAASKAGVARLTEALAEELKDKGVTVNAVLPSIIDTAANRADMPTADFTRWVQPAALADVIVFLASDAARAITGALIPVSGRV